MLDPDDRAILMGAGRPRHFRRGASIITQGDHSDAVYILLSGQVRITVNTAGGREVLLAVDGPGELLGEFEAIDPGGGPRIAANVALEPVECLAMTGNEFREVLHAHPSILLVITRWAIRRLDAADRRRVDAASFDTAHRLARLLVELADSQAHGDVSVHIDIPLTQEDLASMIGASRDAVVRGFTSLRSRDLVATARRQITILDVDALRHYGEEGSRPARSEVGAARRVDGMS